MKLVVLCLTLFLSINGYAKAVDTFKTILKPGIYKGEAFLGECTVIVEEVNFPDNAISVTVNQNGVEVFKLFNNDALFAVNNERQFFFQTDRIYIGANKKSYVEKILKTVQTTDGALNVLVAETLVVATNYEERIAECNLTLKKVMKK
jgi:hypothetical protein